MKLQGVWMEFVISKSKLAETLQNSPNPDGMIGMSALIELFTHLLSDDINMVNEETLQKFLCRETKSYCDMDIAVRESTKMISAARESTGTILEAAKSNDMGRVQSACNDLDAYHKKLEQIEHELYQDEATGLFSRRYIFGKKLEDGKTFDEKGVMVVLKIDRFATILDQYGQHTADSVVKYFAKQLSALLAPPHYEVIRFATPTFLLMISEEQQLVVERKIAAFRSSLANHKFKTADSKVIEFNFTYSSLRYQPGEFFLPAFKQVSAQLDDIRQQ